LDHNTVLQVGDPLIAPINKHSEREVLLMQEAPTVENIANMMAEPLNSILPQQVTVTKLRLFETPNCWATWIRDND